MVTYLLAPFMLLVDLGDELLLLATLLVLEPKGLVLSVHAVPEHYWVVSHHGSLTSTDFALALSTFFLLGPPAPFFFGGMVLVLVLLQLGQLANESRVFCRVDMRQNTCSQLDGRVAG